MKIFLRLLLFVFILMLGETTLAQRLYWVGGSGNFNDAAHWSFQSGGTGGAKSPTATDDVCFDENSFRGHSVINIVGDANCRDLIFADNTFPVILSGTQNEKIVVGGDIKLNTHITNQFSGSVHLVSSKTNAIAHFGAFFLKGNLSFDGTGSYNLETVLGSDNSEVDINNGRVKLVNSTISSGSIFIRDNATLEVTESILKVKNKLWFTNQSTLINNGIYIEAPVDDPIRYNVGNNQIANNRLANNNSIQSACVFTATVITQPTCANFCDGVVEFTIPASCSGSAPYKATWSNGSGCANPVGTPLTGLTAGTYTQSNVCGCGSAYTIVLTNSGGAFAGSINFNVNAPSAIQAFTSTVSPLCNAACNGKIYATIIGGTQPYTNVWTPGPTHAGNTGLDSLINLCVPPSSYTLAVTDAHNCKDTVTVSIAAPTIVVANGNSSPPTCFGSCNGKAWVVPTGGTPFVNTQSNGIHYTTVWDGNPAKNNDTLYNLCANTTHTCVITDTNACTTKYIVTIGAGPLQITFTKSGSPSGVDSINCLNTCNGVITCSNVAGGTPAVGGYTFAWTPTVGLAVNTSTNSSSYSNLCGSVAGTTYTCTIEDANSCTVTATYTVVAPHALTLATSTVAPKCVAGQGVSTGSATATAGGGTSAYTFSWSPVGGTQSGSSPTSTYSNIPAGTYTTYVTDAKGCKDSATVILTAPIALIANITTSVNPTCPNLNNGQLCVTVTAGTGTSPYTYNWTPTGATVSCPTATLTSGNYAITVTDAHSCTVSVSATLVPPPAITVTSATSSPTCFGVSNGSATLTASGGGGGYTYQWSCSATTNSVVTGLAGGTTCNYTVTDANHCKAVGSVTIGTASPLTLILTPTNLSCAGVNSGQITSNAGGGTPFSGPTYTYSWTGTGVAVNAVNQTGLGAGVYTCQITDANGCTKVTTTTITTPPPISLTLAATQPTCAGATNGAITTDTSGGTGVLSHTWSPSVTPANTWNPNNLPSSGVTTTYTLNVMDANGCTAWDTITIKPPTPVLITLTTTSIACNGGTGTATVTATGGTPGYQYNWDNAGFGPITGTISTINNLSGSPATHTIVVEDSKGCLATAQFFNIPQPPVLNVSVKNIINTCNGLPNGGATANVSGGTQPYGYNWNSPGPYSAPDSVTGLAIGSYTLYVEDANGCLGSTTFTINPLVNIAISVSSNTVSCHNACDATGSASASGGIAPYTIQWVNPAITCSNVPNLGSCVASNTLCSGTQTVIATDANSCSSTYTFSIVNPVALAATSTTTPVSCFGQCTGTASVTPTGGTAPYTVTWNPPSGFSGDSVSNLCAGSYTANILDHNGCTYTQTVNVNVSNQFSVTPTYSAPSTCGASDGGISISVSGGSGTYTVNWSPATGTASGASPVFTYSNIPAGSYTAAITDSHGCDTTIVYGLSSPTGPVLNYTVTNASCYGVCDGSATVVATGTNTPITITWQGPPFLGTATTSFTTGNVLCGNPTTTYNVKAVDAIGCITFTTVTVTSPSQIVDHSTISEPVCGGSNGVITLAPTGGSGGGYSYNWNNGALPPNNPETGLPAGIDSVIITDGSGCTQKYTYTLTSVSSPSVTVNTGSVTCSYLANGTATATVIGGTSAFSYTWTNSSGVTVASGTNVVSVSNLSAGSYTVLVSDAHSCTTQTVFTISSPAAINPTFVKQNVLCNGGTGSASITAVSGGNPGYTYLWSTSGSTAASVSSLSPGSYSVTVTDTNHCTDVIPFTITQPSSMTITVVSAEPTCNGGSNGSATVTATGGTPFAGSIYTYTWVPIGTNTSTASNLSAGCYTVIAADSNSCTTATIVCISQPTQINPNVTFTNSSCGGTCNGSIVSTPSGGTGTYTFTWSPPGVGTINSTPNSSTYSNLCAGTSYTLVVTDANNCSVNTPVTLSSPVLPSLTYTTVSPACGASNGSITITGTTGNGAVNINWINTLCGSSLNCTNLAAGSYSVQLTDTASCTDTVTVLLSNSNGPVVVTSFTNVTCFGSSNGAAFDTVISGSSPYTYSWIPSVITTSTATSSLNSGLVAGNYSSIVKDNLGCITITTFTITQPTQIIDAPNFPNNATCLGINNGTIISNGTGGTHYANGYLYAIDSGPYSVLPSASYTFSSLSAGSHTVCIKDSLGCDSCFIYTVLANSTIVSTISATNATCFGSCNGAATVSNINGGTPNYAITWNNSQVGLVANSLCAGTYIATITDAVGCKAMDTITITAPNSINPNPSVTNPSCGQSNGSITVTPTGGNTGSYTYSWTPSGNTNTITNVGAGVSQVDIADALGCEQTFLIPVSNSNSPTVTIAATNATCGNLCNGAITTTVTGGILPYTYFWPIGTQTTSAINNQCAGNYIVEVQDAAGCIASQSVALTAPSTFTVNIANTAPGCGACNGAIAATVVGASTYSYQWSANAGSVTTSSVTNLCASVYTLVVTDNVSGCTQTKVIILNSNAGPSLSVSNTPATCYGLCNGTATVAITGGTPVITQMWNTTPPQTAITANSLCGDSTYIVQVKDGAGCIQTAQTTINQPTQLSSGLPIITQIKCNNNTNGAISVDVFGGTPVYTYSWNPATILGTGGTNLGFGTYSVTVTDANGCPLTLSTTLTNPPILSITGTVTPATCNTVPDGAIATTTSGGIPNYTWQWSGGSTATTASLSAILPGNYTVVVTDSRLCTDSADFTVISTVSVTANAGRDTFLCSNIPIILTGIVTGATTFDWQTITGTIINPVNTLTLSVNPATTTQYVLLAQNAGCVDMDTVTVSIAPLAVANAGPSQSILTGQSATIGGNPSNPSGGTIVWYPNTTLSDSTSSNPIASPAATTIYTVVVTNILGCKAIDTMVVTILPPFVIPTGFTPNGDGKNDAWVIDNMNLFPNVEIEVYNRWGEQLFYSKGNYTPWMGTYNGKPVPVGTYYYIIRLNDPKYPDHYAGPLTILR